jgi:DNA-binding NarL/FixJ family response regulator
MLPGTQHVHETIAPGKKRSHSNGARHTSLVASKSAANAGKSRPISAKPRVYVAAENLLQTEVLSRMLLQSGEIEVVGAGIVELFQTEDLHKQEANVLLLSSHGNGSADLAAVRKAHATAPNVQILLIGVMGDEAEFLRCVRAGVHGYLQQGTSADEVVEAVQALQSGEAVCPGSFCAVLFHYLERQASSFPSASVHQRLGLTRREQQLIPLIAEGLTNKEIANRFCLSEQTVKNHLYRMKHKIGAEDRLSIVQVCRAQGFVT